MATNRTLLGFLVFFAAVIVFSLVQVLLLFDDLQIREMPKTYRSPSKKRFVSDSLRIPAIVHRTQKDMRVGKGMLEHCHEKWVALNPDYDMTWFEDRDCWRTFDDFPQKEDLRKAWNLLKPGAYKADLWRYCQLYQHGGVYVDSFAMPHVPIDQMFAGLRGCTFISSREKYGIHNGFMACTPKHPFMKAAIEECIKNILNRRYTDHDLGITGPLMLKRVVNRCLKRDRDQDFHTGFNGHGSLRFYLFNMKRNITMSIYRGKDKLLDKKYSIRMQAYLLYTNKSLTTYYTKWKNRDVYN